MNRRCVTERLADTARHHAELIEYLAYSDPDHPDYPSYLNQLRECRRQRLALQESLGTPAAPVPAPKNIPFPLWRTA